MPKITSSALNRAWHRQDDVLVEVACWKRLELPELKAQVSKFLGQRPRLEATVESRDLLSQLVQSPNAKDALEAFRELSSADIPAHLVTDLCLNIARPRTGATEGRRGVLTKDQALRIGLLLGQLSPAQWRRLKKILGQTQLGGGFEVDPVAERGLILKALLVHTRDSKVQWKEIEGFAEGIRGLPRYALMRSTTLLDIDSRQSSSGLDTVSLSRGGGETLNAISLRAHQTKNNDGLIQSFDSSCGPAAAEVVLGEVDPTFAFRVHTEGGPHSLSGQTIAEKLQEVWIRHFGDKPRRRKGAYDYGRLKKRSAKLMATGEISKTEHLALLRYARDPEIEASPSAKQALKVIRQHGRFPTQKELEVMRRSSPAAMTEGTTSDEYREVLRGLLGGPMRAQFKLYEGEGQSLLDRTFSALLRASQMGGAIMGTVDHWWAVVDAERTDDGGRLLIHDPYTGITAWVPTEKLVDGSFSRTHFHWHTRTDLDTFFIPVAK